MMSSKIQLLRGDQPEEKESPSVEVPTHRKLREEEISEALRKTFLAMSDDIRVVLVKLADRLHTMRTLSHLSVDMQKRISRETLDIFAPLANRLGIWQVKWELQDLAFRYVAPKEYKEIAEKLANRRADREKQIHEIIKRLEQELTAEGVDARITGRPKHIYSIYQKMSRKEMPFEMLMDLRGVRLIVDDVAAYKIITVRIGNIEIKGRAPESMQIEEEDDVWIHFPQEYLMFYKNGKNIL